MTSPRLHSWPGRAALSRRPFRVASRDRPFLDLFSRGRAGPSESRGFSAAQIEQIQRTVMGRTPEVMAKVTGGGRRVGAVAAHLSYISQHGKLDLETDDGQHVFREGQKELLRSWHLELTRGQYRQPRGESGRRQAGAQRHALDAGTDAAGGGTGGGKGLRAGEVRGQAPVCHGTAHASKTPPRAPGRQGRGHRRKASPHR